MKEFWKLSDLLKRSMVRPARGGCIGSACYVIWKYGIQVSIWSKDIYVVVRDFRVVSK